MEAERTRHRESLEDFRTLLWWYPGVQSDHALSRYPWGIPGTLGPSGTDGLERDNLQPNM